ncbi:quinone oxidoreductase [Cohnella endophytica]|uniref:Quinone oxidoreductase n=1 Tax=Cohnella endophytica TaxID=2419778 RepID=A0A494Y2F8_9BACL|nr:quinone oxidoreductase [Cohnella endophytica]RKP54046.1 quinone oxidoreductase [Cohnella endophytica]
MKALVFREFGGPEVLHMSEVADPVLVAGSIIVRMRAIGLNFADIYRRRGNYHLAGQAPWILGYEGAGIVEQVGEGVEGIRVGDRVGFADAPHANAELVAVSADRVIPLPPDISFEQAASVLLQGLTAHYLVNDSYPVRAGEEVLVHAAAGGVGQLLIQLCKNKGARVLGLTSSDAKRQVAMDAGADETLLYGNDGSWVSKAQEWSVGRDGLNVAYDSVGSTLLDSFAAVKAKGAVVFYGMAGGDPPPIDPRMLMDTSSTLTGGDLWNHVTTREERIRRAASLFADMAERKLKIERPKQFALRDGAEAHRYMESRQSTGKIVFIP